ncbi:hypothetical protein A9P82_00680 [Arachidicoccus ginsenosidimutans]|uniref:c-type cytochrome n=1 Tax=Arachidicoccus sp. BS20 TaxID=1850526 RepID=UPI0007F12D6B|nr:c-type cytochrome [Arachidicoccus sp. BS20]ANI90536.1 hypothetical protein A9P82_00680 [Arachidicoccus sp. BS20]
MKKYIVLFGTVLTMAFAACGGGNSSAKDASGTATSTADDISKNSDYKKGLDLISKSDCLTCHNVTGQGTGPAYTDVANKYDSTDIDMLAKKIISGGSGHWGTVPMVPHPTLSLDDAKQIVKYILLLKSK